MAELKTKTINVSVTDYINEIKDEKIKSDCFSLLKIFKSATKKKPKVWGNGTIGFGTYYYKSEKSSQEGEWFATGFAPRKQNLTIYILAGLKAYSNQLKKLGKHKISSGSCIYIKNLEEINIDVLKELIQKSLIDLGSRFKIK